MNGLRVGVVGGGSIAEKVHLPQFEDNERTEVVALAEVDEQRREHVRRKFRIANSYSTAEQMLESETLDVVSICTPPNTHREIFVAAANAGCHIYCEKPVALSAREAESMADAARDNGVLTQVGYGHHYFHNSRIVLDLVEHDVLQDVTSFDATFYLNHEATGWRNDPEISGGGVLTDVGPHIVDMLVRVVSAQRTEPETEVETSTVTIPDGSDVESRATAQLTCGDTRANVDVRWSERMGDYSRYLLADEDSWIEFDRDALTGSVKDTSIKRKRGKPPTLDVEFFDFTYGIPEPGTSRIADFVSRIVAGDSTTSAPIEHAVKVRRTLDEIYANGAAK